MYILLFFHSKVTIWCLFLSVSLFFKKQAYVFKFKVFSYIFLTNHILLSGFNYILTFSCFWHLHPRVTDILCSITLFWIIFSSAFTSSTVPRLCLGCSSTVPRLFLDCSSTVPRLCLDCASACPRLFLDFFLCLNVF